MAPTGLAPTARLAVCKAHYDKTGNLPSGADYSWLHYQATTSPKPDPDVMLWLKKTDMWTKWSSAASKVLSDYAPKNKTPPPSMEIESKTSCESKILKTQILSSTHEFTFSGELSDEVIQDIQTRAEKFYRTEIDVALTRLKKSTSTAGKA